MSFYDAVMSDTCADWPRPALRAAVSMLVDHIEAGKMEGGGGSGRENVRALQEKLRDLARILAERTL